MTPLVIKDTLIITQNSQREVLRGDILIEGTKIRAVGVLQGDDRRLAKDAEVINGKNKIALPGLINAHTHAAMVLLRGYADDMELQSWLEQKIWPREATLTPHDIERGVALAIIEMIMSGTTAFMDMYFHPLITARVCERFGMRANIGLVFFDFNPSLVQEAFSCEPPSSSLISFSMAPHAPYTVGSENLLRAKERAKKLGIKTQIHLSETRKEVYDSQKIHGLRPVEYLNSFGFFDETVVAFHCGWVTRREIRILATHGVTAVHCPISNLKLATGALMPIPEMLSEGVSLALGTDGASSNNTLDMFETMKMSALLQKFSRWDPTIVSAQQALDWATLGGAHALGINAGSIEPGKLADVILLNLDANLLPLHNPISNVVYAARAGNVNDTIINGTIVMRDRHIVGAKKACHDVRYVEKWR